MAASAGPAPTARRSPANAHELTALLALTKQTVDLLAPYRAAKRDPHPRWSAVLSRVRYRIDTVFGRLVDHCSVKRVWVRDLWHLCSHLLRKVLMHTLAVLFTVVRDNPPLHLARLVTA